MGFLWVFIGGGCGSLVRYLLGLAFLRTTINLPIATLLANVSSCVIFAVTLWMFREKVEIPQNIRQLLLVGVCGGMSTFSSFSYDTFELLKNQQYAWASANIILNTLLCLSIFYIFSKLT